MINIIFIRQANWEFLLSISTGVILLILFYRKKMTEIGLNNTMNKTMNKTTATLTTILSNDKFSLRKLNPLTFAKSEFPICELSGKVATIELITPQLTFYFANKEIAEQCWYGIIEETLDLLIALRTPQQSIGTIEDRRLYTIVVENRKRKYMEVSLNVSSKHLLAHNYNLVIPAAIFSLRIAQELEGPHGISTVEPHLHLGQAFSGLQEYSKALENLGSAQWIILKSSESSERIKGRLFSLLGNVFKQQGEYDLAKEKFAKAIICIAEYTETDSLAVSSNYFCLGDLFYLHSNHGTALAYFDKVVTIWLKYLLDLHKSIDPSVVDFLPCIDSNISSFIIEKLRKDESNSKIFEIEEVYHETGYKELQQIQKYRKELLPEKHIGNCDILLVLSLFEFFILSDLIHLRKSEENLNHALRLYIELSGVDNDYSKYCSELIPIVKHERLKFEQVEADKMNELLLQSYK